MLDTSHRLQGMADRHHLSFPMEVEMSTLTYLLTYLDKIPATFWSFIIAGFFTLSATLSGIILTNRAHDRRLQTQFIHDQNLKNREREMSLRKDIYLAAAEAVSAGLIAVGRFANFEVPHEKLTEGYLDKAPSIAKVHIIAKEETVRAVVNFSGELSATFLRLATRRFTLVAQKQQIEFLKSQVDGFNKEQARTLELMKQHNLDGLNDPRKWNTLQQNFDFEQHRIDQTLKERSALAAMLYPNQLKYIEDCMEETIRLGRLLTPVIFSVRKELELPLNEVEYRKVTEEAVAKQLESLKEFMQQLRSAIATQATADASPTPGP